MRIAIIGYGSLIWDLDTLEEHVRGNWHLGAGPELPVEFSRVSPKRQFGLVLVLDNEAERASLTNVIESRKDRVELAAEDLAVRERAPVERIGIATRDGQKSSRSDKHADFIISWLQRVDYDAAVWTDLQGNFQEHTGMQFSHNAGLKYLKSLNEASLFEAWRYITHAPDHTWTPFRQHLSDDPWWQSLSRLFGANNE